jgi:cytochrome c2
MSVRLLDDPERRALKLHRSMPIAAIILLLPLLLVGCRDGAQGSEAGGDPERGAALIGRIGCGTCHIVPGIPGAAGFVGPPLDHMGSRIYIAGVLRNTPDNMIVWLRNPQAIVFGNAMPNMGLDRKQAQDIAGYLYTLR